MAPETNKDLDGKGGADPFELLDDEPGSKPARPAAQSAPAGFRPPLVVPPPDAADATGVSKQTVREKADPASRAHQGPIAPPANWPKEMWKYPIRGLGVLRFGILIAIFAAVDELYGWNAFVGWAAKLAALLCLVRWQIRAVASTASGRDEVPPLGLDGTWEEFVWPALGFLGVAGLLTAPALFTWFLLPLMSKDPLGTTGWVLVAIPVLYLPIVMLGQALGDLSMKWPHRAVPWLFRGFGATLLVSAGWLALGLVEWPLTSTAGTVSLLRIPLHILLRAASLYAVTLGARALGVVGRKYDGTA